MKTSRAQKPGLRLSGLLLFLSLLLPVTGLAGPGSSPPRAASPSGQADRALDPTLRTVPRWLIELPELSTPVTLGVAGFQPGARDATEEAARTQAALHFQLQHGVTVRLDRTRKRVPGDLSQLDASQLEPLRAGAPDPKSVQCLETWEDTERGLLWCLAVSSQANAWALRVALKPYTQSMHFSREEPAWMRTPKARAGARAATGYAMRTPRHYAEQLELALRRGIIALALQGEVEVESTLEAERAGLDLRVESTTQFSGEVTVRDIRLESLWRASEGDALYVRVGGTVR